MSETPRAMIETFCCLERRGVGHCPDFDEIDVIATVCLSDMRISDVKEKGARLLYNRRNVGKNNVWLPSDHRG